MNTAYRKFRVAAIVSATCLLASALVALAPAAPPPAETFYLHTNDTVVFYGDSITEQRLYSMLTELYAVTRYPKLNVRFVHSGWGGDRVTGGSGGPIDVRLNRDVLAYHPTVMTIMLGMNDGGYATHVPANDETFFAGYKHIVESMRRSIPALRITAIDPSPFDDVTRPLTLQPDGYNAVLAKYGAWIRNYAVEAKLDFADLNTPAVDMLRQANTSDPALAPKIIPDRVHPGLAGHLIMAEALLKSWDARAVVSTVSLDAKTGKVTQSEFAQVTDLHPGAPFVWTQTDESLPLPFAGMLAQDRDHSLALAIRSSDVTAALNQQMLQVRNLTAGRYKLSIDGAAIGEWNEAELAQAVNLAILDTPMSRQALEVRDLTVKHLDVHQQRVHTFQAQMQALDLEHLEDTLKAIDTLDNEIVARQRAAARPRPHVFQLAPAQ
ncbi:MAG TPA: SGNH/GDSL hydrolase family protein [Bryobacteraceae bacterium]|nr:SGNH/GDSL hydrolase family protein [Bryobacteraceae bacterium]